MSRAAQVELPHSFYEANLITEVLQVVQSGKEATVYCCRAHPSTGVEYLAAKVYRPRAFRSFQNDAVYLQGRSVHGIDEQGAVRLGRGKINRRLSRAVRKKSRTGREAQFGSWISQEFGILGRLHAAGADVPRPVEWAGSSEAAFMRHEIARKLRSPPGDRPRSFAPPVRAISDRHFCRSGGRRSGARSLRRRSLGVLFRTPKRRAERRGRCES
jgi:hypothetical protein